MVRSTKKVLLINWDSYPNFATGGVYFWAKRLIEGLPNWKFIVFHQLSNPNASAEYPLPPNVEKVIELPIFGTSRYEEYCDDGRPLLRKIRETPKRLVEESFLPLFESFMAGFIADDSDASQLVELVCELRKVMRGRDSKKLLEHPATWEIFLDCLRKDPLYREMGIREALTAFRVMQRGLQMLSLELPRVDITHCSLAWLPSFMAIVVKREQGSPILITEHGVAYRELLLYYNAYLYDQPSKIFWKVFSRNVVRAIYEAADIIAPVCRANEVWEKTLGADPSKIRVVYNGIDTERFRPMDIPREERVPTVISVARVDPFKDITTLAYAIKYAKERIPNIRCLLYGDSNNLDYSRRCVSVVESLALGESFKFMGSTKEPEKAYNSGDLVVFSGITEGFPFSIIEAMACGKAIVATAVGGVPEALGECGLLVKSRQPRDLAKAVTRLLTDEKLRNQLGAASLKRAREQFSIGNSIQRISELYESLTSPEKGPAMMTEASIQR
jgi:glycosyltransferase involved in cell wall biosynthesis